MTAGGAPRARVVALGQPLAGDDGVGPAVLEALRRRGLPPGVELVHAPEASALVEAVQLAGPVVVVDALLAAPAGRVVLLAAEDLDAAALSTVSSHGISAGGAIALARSLAPGAVSRRLAVVAVSIEAPGRYREGLSPEVAAAVGPAADEVLRLLAAA